MGDISLPYSPLVCLSFVLVSSFGFVLFSSRGSTFPPLLSVIGRRPGILPAVITFVLQSNFFRECAVLFAFLHFSFFLVFRFSSLQVVSLFPITIIHP